MSWLNNMSVPPKSRVSLAARPRRLEVRLLCFAHALEHGLPWGAAGIPDCVSHSRYTGCRLEPWMVVALLKACRKRYRGNRTARPDIERADRDVTVEQAVTALEEAARRCGLPRAALAKPVPDQALQFARQNGGLCADLELTMAVLAKCTRNAFVAAKRPSLDGIGRAGGTELLLPDRALFTPGQEGDHDA